MAWCMYMLAVSPLKCINTLWLKLYVRYTVSQQNFEVRMASWNRNYNNYVACTYTVTTVDYQTFMHADVCILVKVQILVSVVYKM